MILYEDSELLIVHKPAGLATQTARLGQADLVSELKNYRSSKGEPAYIGVVNRLDQPVEGLIAFAKTQSAAGALGKQLQDGTLKKSYLALVAGEPGENAGGKLTDYLLKDSRAGISRVVEKNTCGAKKAELSWRCVKAFTGSGFALAEVWLYTGRHHQIRVQLANAGMPLLGDVKYGSAASGVLSGRLGVTTVALCAYHMELLHPKTGKRLEYTIDWDVLGRVEEALGNTQVDAK